jgi:hypothetical protein
MHGGQSVIGPASGTFKTGRYSKLLPKGLLERYTTAQADPDLHNLTEEIQLIDVRIADLMGRLHDGGVKAGQALAALGTLHEAIAAEDLDAANRAATVLADALAGGADTTWAEIVRLTDHRRKLVESDTRRKQMLMQMVPVEKLLIFMQALADSVRKHVNDPAALRAIQQDMAALGVMR